MKVEQSKKLGFWNIVGLGLGGAIGTGIFILLGFGIGYTGRSIMLICAVGCFWMLLAYWYNVAMPNMFVLKGGDYSMKALLMNPTMTGFSAWLIIINSFAMSGYALAIVDFLAELWPSVQTIRSLLAAIIMTIFFLSTIKGSRFLTILENIITVILVLAIVLFIAYGFPQVNPTVFFSEADGGFFHGGFGGLVSGLAVMGWACQGTTMAPVGMTAVTEHPKRNVTKGILWINVFLAIIYGLMGYVASGVLPYDQIAGQNIAVTAKAIMPTALYLFFVIGGGICAIASSTLGGLGMFRYPLIQIAEDGWLPKVFKKQTKSGYPWVTYLFYYILSLLPILLNMDVDVIISLVMIPSMIINAYMNFACLKLPKRFPEQWAKRAVKFPVPLYNILCIIGTFAAGFVAFQLFKDLTFENSLIALGILAAIFLATYIRLKQGAVKKEELDKQKQDIYRMALEDDVD